MSTKDIILSKLSDLTMIIVIFVPLSLLFVYLGTFKRIKLFPNKRIGFKVLSVLGAYFVLAMILVPLNEIITSNYSQEYKDALPFSSYSFNDYKEIDVFGSDKAYHVRKYYDDISETSEDVIIILKNDLIYCLEIKHGLYAGHNPYQNYYAGYDFDYERAEILAIREDISLLIERLEFTENVKSSDIDVAKFQTIILDNK